MGERRGNSMASKAGKQEKKKRGKGGHLKLQKGKQGKLFFKVRYREVVKKEKHVIYQEK